MNETKKTLLEARRALTLHRPWDYAILNGTKWVENRSWAPKAAPGWIFLHSGSTWADRGVDMARAMDGASGLSTLEWEPFRIHGMVYVSGFIQPHEMPKDLPPELAAWKESASVGWLIDQVAVFTDEAVAQIGSVRGAQRLWNLDARTLALVQHQIGSGNYTMSSWRERWERAEQVAALRK
jgi:hypothetical protein